MRPHSLVLTKLAETASRGLFLLVCLYGLRLDDAGRFGLFTTAVGLISFALGFERQVDLLRSVSGLAVAAIRSRFADTLRFFGLQYAVVLPVVMLAGWAAELSTGIVLLGAVIAVGEHLSNQAYQAALVTSKAAGFMVAVALKNVLQLALVAAYPVLSDGSMTLDAVLLIWAGCSLGFILVAVVMWTAWRPAREVGGEAIPRQSIPAQYQASHLHFLAGLVAVVALQIDRVVVGGTLGVSEVGIYFRNVTLAAIALQIFNVASFNRVAPDVYRHSREGNLRQASSLIRGEYTRFSVGFTTAVIILLGMNLLLGAPLARWHLETVFLGLLTLAVLIRAAADYGGLILLSSGADALVLRNQTIAVLGGACLLFSLSWKWALVGAFAGALGTPLLYLALNAVSVMRWMSTNS